MKNLSLISASFLFFFMLFVLDVHANPRLFHASSKAAAKKIAQKGFAASKMNSSARFGKGVYVSRTAKGAVAEKKGARAVVGFSRGRGFPKSTINMSRPTPDKIRATVGVRDLRGSVKKGVVGPKLGKKIGKKASVNGQAVVYRSAKDFRSTNVFIPKREYLKKSNILTKPKVRVIAR